MEDALAQKNKDIAAAVTGLDVQKLQAVALATAKQALEINHVESPLVTEALTAGGTAAEVEVLRTQLEAFADTIEAPYLDAMDHDQLEGRDDLMAKFCQARAVTALAFALDPTEKSARISLYESLHAVVSPDFIMAQL